MYRIVGIAFSLFCVAIPLAHTPLSAQTPPIEGHFIFDPDSSDDIHRAIDQAIRELNFIVRQVARTRLRRINDAYTTLAISQSGSDVVVVLEGRQITSPASGEEIQWRRETGEVLGVATRWQERSLEQTFTVEDGTRINVFTLDPSGETLNVHVTITSDRLPRPLTYNLRYQRQS